MPAHINPDIDNQPNESGPRFDVITRRAWLRAGAAAAGLAMIPGLVACGNSDKDTLAASTTAKQTTTTAVATTAAPSTTSAPSSTAAPSTTAATTEATTTTADATTTTAAPAAGGTFPSGGELAVNFTYTAGSGGMGPAKNPYIAVWIEDADGNLVSVLAAWYLQSQKGQRWLNDLVRWYSIGGVEASGAATGATRAAGDYSLSWNGTDLEGNPVPEGEYAIYIEGAREKGPYELVSGAFTVSAEGFATADLTPVNEITAASVALNV